MRGPIVDRAKGSLQHPHADSGSGKRKPSQMNICVRESVQLYAMSTDTFRVEFIGGSRDGEIVEATDAPEYFEILVSESWKEIYERQSDEPPFVYVQIGYAQNETWK
jgi:hypothetical protein